MSGRKKWEGAAKKMRSSCLKGLQSASTLPTAAGDIS